MELAPISVRTCCAGVPPVEWRNAAVRISSLHATGEEAVSLRRLSLEDSHFQSVVAGRAGQRANTAAGWDKKRHVGSSVETSPIDDVGERGYFST